ncbi:helix-turn-helix domain-containing protein [Rhodoglobus sp. NPDC076762]
MTVTRDIASDDASERFEIGARHRELLDHVLDKWSLEILNLLCDRPSRFSELRRAIPAVSQKSLTTTLRRLERNGIIERAVLSTRPLAVEYLITPLGKTLRSPIDEILHWVDTKMPEVESARRRFDDEAD